MTHLATAAERSPDFRAAAVSVRVQRPAELWGVQARRVQFLLHRLLHRHQKVGPIHSADN